MGFYPATPRGELAKEIGQVLEEEGQRLGMNLRAVESGGVSLKRQLVRPDLKAGEPCGRPNCVLDRVSGGAGGPHNTPGCVYRGTCKLCGAVIISSKYWGESGFSAYHRCQKHEKEVERRDEGNAFAKHLANFHPDHQGDITAFDIQVMATFKKPLPRKKTEAVKIQSSRADNLLNSKAEHRQPALFRVRMTRENDDPQPAGGRGGRGGGGRGGRGGRGRGRWRGRQRGRGQKVREEELLRLWWQQLGLVKWGGRRRGHQSPWGGQHGGSKEVFKGK